MKKMKLLTISTRAINLPLTPFRFDEELRKIMEEYLISGINIKPEESNTGYLITIGLFPK